MNRRGFVEAEVLLAVTIFALLVTTVGGVLYSLRQSEYLSGMMSRATFLAEGGLEAVRSLRDRAINEMIYNQSAVEITGNAWSFVGEGTEEALGDFTRTITLEPVCRNAAEEITTCPGNRTDISMKKVTSTIDWTTILGVHQSLSLTNLLSNWGSMNWIQTDWSGGSGQTLWSDATKYATDDGNIDPTISGEVKLAMSTGGVSCSSKVWDFSTSSEYTFDPALIEVTGGMAQLKNIGGISMTTLTSVDSYATGVNASHPNMVHVSGNVYAYAFSGSGNDGFISTVTISPTGAITKSIIDTFEYDTVDGYDPDLMYISGNIYAVAYRGSGNDGWVATVTISTAGVITKTVIDTLEWDTANGYEPDIFLVSGNVYGVAYRGTGSAGIVKTFTIDTAGNIGAAVIDTLTFDATGNTPFVLSVGAGYWAIVYSGPGNDGWMATVNITSAGIIPATITDSYEFDPSNGQYPSIGSLGGDKYLVAYTGAAGDGWLATFAVSSTGVITKSLIDTLEFDASDGTYPVLKKVTGTFWTVSYTGSGNDGFVVLVNAAADGILPAAVTASLEYDPTYSLSPSVVYLSDYYFGIAYIGSANNVKLATFSVTGSATTLYSTTNPSIFPTSSQTATSFDEWTSFTEVATKGTGEIYYQLSDDNGVTWYWWNGTTWAVAGTGNYNSATVVNSKIYAFPVASGQIKFRAFLSSSGTQQVQLDSVTIGCSAMQFEIGSINANNTWQTVTMLQNYSDPIVVGSYQEIANTADISVRIRNVTTTTFDVRLESASGASISADPVTYFVMERGVWTIGGFNFEAQKQTVATVATASSWVADQVTFHRGFGIAPFVMHQVMSQSDSKWITTWVSQYGTRTNPPISTGFGLGLNAAEVAASATHGAETVGWIATDANVGGTLGGVLFETHLTGSTVQGHDNGCYTTPYSYTYTAAPKVLGFQQTMNDPNGGWAVVCSNSTAQPGFHIEEDSVLDAERSHGTEQIGFLAFSTGTRYSSVGGSLYPLYGELTSSAFNLTDVSPVQILEWDEETTSCTPACTIKIQVRTAPDVAGAPGIFTSWYGAGGVGTYFTDPAGSLIPKDLNWNQWVEYRVELAGDGIQTPVLQEVRLNYR
ncbi:MAG: hypothetical protein WC730_01275 [Patescibacteria group bacterium]|jgi:hypothetical protein